MWYHARSGLHKVGQSMIIDATKIEVWLSNWNDGAMDASLVMEYGCQLLILTGIISTAPTFAVSDSLLESFVDKSYNL